MESKNGNKLKPRINPSQSASQLTPQLEPSKGEPKDMISIVIYTKNYKLEIEIDE
jgi:hypothetical protein